MQSFPEIVRSLQDQIDFGPDAPYFEAPERVAEAADIGPCVWRMAYGELDITGDLTASRTPFLGSPPSLAGKLGRRIADAHLTTFEALVEAVYRAVAIGYMLMFKVVEERMAPVAPGRSAEDIWDYWSPGFRTPLRDVGVPRQWANRVMNLGSSSLISDLKHLRLTRFLGGSQLNHLGMIYAQAGVWLRLAQIEDNEAGFTEALRLARDDTDRRCRFGDYPDEGAAALDGLRH
jgi:hypothetical protein